MQILWNLMFAVLGVVVSFLCVNQIFMSVNCGMKTVKELEALQVIDAGKVRAKLYMNILLNLILAVAISFCVYALGGSFSSFIVAFVLFSFLVARKSGRSKHNLENFMTAYAKYISPEYLEKFKNENQTGK